jgi:hypothetical protein
MAPSKFKIGDKVRVTWGVADHERLATITKIRNGHNNICIYEIRYDGPSDYRGPLDSWRSELESIELLSGLDRVLMGMSK